MSKVKVILVKDQSLGQAGKECIVNRGYARNFLLPNKFAVYWSLKAHETVARRLEDQEKVTREHNNKLLEAINTIDTLSMNATANEQGVLYVAIKKEEILEAINALIKDHDVRVKPNMINTDTHVKHTGKHTINISIDSMTQVSIDMKVTKDV